MYRHLCVWISYVVQQNTRGKRQHKTIWHLSFIQGNLAHWDRVTHICVSKLTIIDSDNGLSPDRRQAIIWTSAGILLTGPLGIDFSEILIEIQTFSFKKRHSKMSSAKWRVLRLGLNVLNFILAKCSSLSATVVVILTNSGAANNENFRAPFPCSCPNLRWAMLGKEARRVIHLFASKLGNHWFR